MAMSKRKRTLTTDYVLGMLEDEDSFSSSSGSDGEDPMMEGSDDQFSDDKTQFINIIMVIATK